MSSEKSNDVDDVMTCVNASSAASRGEDALAVGIWTTLLLYALFLNLLTVLGVVRDKRMLQTTSYWFVLSLCACDLLMVAISLGHLMPATLLHDAFVEVHEARNRFAIFAYDVFWYSGVIQLGEQMDFLLKIM